MSYLTYPPDFDPNGDLAATKQEPSAEEAKAYFYEHGGQADRMTSWMFGGRLIAFRAPTLDHRPGITLGEALNEPRGTGETINGAP